ncbi:MAG: hypothetical protein HND42_12410 [Armatimonadetes bacterium]|nr:hypothetical protein [Armatimonadota bacterium]
MILRITPTHGMNLLRDFIEEEQSMWYTIAALAVAGAAMAGAYSLLRDSLSDIW